ncbi:MAG: helix-turn-helix transcriptional regulator [Clostridia bacterium]|nr:helix-turn-helix transcriptional regulator [Clostridia bacterium]
MAERRTDNVHKTKADEGCTGSDAPITTREWYVINDIISEIYKSPDTTQARRAVLDRIGELIPFSTGSFMLAALQGGILDYFDGVLFNASPESIEDYLENYQHLDPMIAFYSQKGEMVYIDSEYVPESMAKASLLYQDWFWPNGMYYMLGGKLMYNDILLGSMLLGRDRDETDFTLREKEILRIIGDHLSYKIYTIYPNGVTKQAVELGGDPLAVKYGLSYREIEVAELLYKGKTTREVACSLYISENTVKRHASSIYKKMGVSGKPQLIVMMRQAGQQDITSG